MASGSASTCMESSGSCRSTSSCLSLARASKLSMVLTIFSEMSNSRRRVRSSPVLSRRDMSSMLRTRRESRRVSSAMVARYLSS